MKCRSCGAELLDSDVFCVKCGKKIENNICEKCGEPLREGTRFCPKCGNDVGDKMKEETGDIPVTSQLATKDIPFDIIEKNIIFEAAQQMQSREYKESSEKNVDYHLEQTMQSVRNSNVYENDSYDDHNEDDNHYEETYYDDDLSDEDYDLDEEYDDEEFYDDDSYDEEDDDYDDYEDDNKDNMSKMITIAMVIAGILLLIGIAAIFFNYKNKSYHPEEDEIILENSSSNEDDQSKDIVGSIIIVKDVNIRDNPNTENSNIIKVAKTDEIYSYYGYSQDMNWYHIKLDDSTDGYVYKEYVEVK